MKKKVFAFDLGKASIGYCVRDGFNINEANSIIIDKDHAETTSLRDRRRIKRTLDAHKAREEFFNTIWSNVGLKILDKNDENFKKEFPTKDEDIIYTSCLLRIALLQNKKLEQWQIYKALHNAFQRRGYDVNIAWKSVQTDDDKENIELIKKYTCENDIELINSNEYKYPCYYDALRLGLWSEEEPQKLNKVIPHNNFNKVRTTNYVAPRKLVEKELKQLWLNAQLQLPQLNSISAEEFLYGEYKIPYGSCVQKEFKQYRGTKKDWQGVLCQKIPRFDNRIIAKCKLLPKRNVCKANTIENVSFVLLMKLKNLRFTDISGEKLRLNPIHIKQIYENWLEKIEDTYTKDLEKAENLEKERPEKRLNITITKQEIEKVINTKIIDKFEPMKAETSGRSSFCKRACQIMNKIILSGELYPQNVDISEFVDKDTARNGITKKEIQTMLSKIGDWNNLYVPDNREENAENASDSRVKTDIMLGNITNPIVRNRLQIFRDLLLDLAEKYGTPDEVIFEFVRDGADNSLYGKIKAENNLKNLKANEKENEQIVKELKEAGLFIDGQNNTNAKYFLMHKLLKSQGGVCAYSGQKIAPTNYDECEIDHIYPRTLGGNDALYNKVVCYRRENQDKKGRTPYEWLSSDNDKWANYVNRLNKIKKQLGKKKFELLTSKPEDCEKLIESYNGLAETSHIARVAQQMTAFIFGWGLQIQGESRRIFVNNGSSTCAIRKRYGLNKLLGDDLKKNRSNDKHHALDAICISFSRDFKYDKDIKKDIIKGFNPEIVKNAIDKIMPYPYANDKPFKGNTKPLETIYGLRTYGDKSYITQRVELNSIDKKATKIKSIIDETIKNDLLNKLEENPTEQEWKLMLQDYIHPKKKTKVKKVMIIVSEGEITKDSNDRERIGEFVDFGTKGTQHQFKHSKGHKGQILYFNQKGIVKVMPVYSNTKITDIKDKLQNIGCKLYNKGQMFYSGCLVDIQEPFKAGSKEYPAGIYKLRTINIKGDTILENNCGIEILTRVTHLTNAKFKKVKSK